ncbi:hypothetical protein HCN44_009911, partial [Aphidius gifuensis]
TTVSEVRVDGALGFAALLAVGVADAFDCAASLAVGVAGIKGVAGLVDGTPDFVGVTQLTNGDGFFGELGGVLETSVAHFLEITNESINNAIKSLKQPQENKSRAIDVLRKIDLRIEAVFTRFQTLHFQKRFPQQIKDKISRPSKGPIYIFYDDDDGSEKLQNINICLEANCAINNNNCKSSSLSSQNYQKRPVQIQIIDIINNKMEFTIKNNQLSQLPSTSQPLLSRPLPLPPLVTTIIFNLWSYEIPASSFRGVYFHDPLGDNRDDNRGDFDGDVDLDDVGGADAIDLRVARREEMLRGVRVGGITGGARAGRLREEKAGRGKGGTFRGRPRGVILGRMPANAFGSSG